MRLKPSPAWYPCAGRGQTEVELSRPCCSFASKKYWTHLAHRWHLIKEGKSTSGWCSGDAWTRCRDFPPFQAILALAL